ncbi:MAG TPA: 2-phospho-L-lactate transferase [Herpetosiphonaceae bacterium]|nr:2-phospho-L-lactate transferase [Herpetosiphonaceae bacterium]
MSSQTALNNASAAVPMSKIVALAGGVGGAKLAHGLYQALVPDALTVIVNTADDFTYWGLRVSPDLDTVMYTLAGIANENTGWGVADETWSALDAAGRLGGETWFRIGDRDLATHVLRTEALRAGKSLTAVTAEFAARLGIHGRLLPMTDAAVATMIETPDGWLAFQDYFVRRQHRDPVRAIRLDGIEQAEATDDARQAIESADLIIFCPSNPIVSIGPILSLPGVQDLLKNHSVPRVAVSPIVGGKALRGPADTMLSALGHDSSALGVARLYQDLLTGIVIDELDAEDAPAIRKLGMEVLVAGTVMRSIPDRRSLAERILQWCARLR